MVRHLFGKTAKCVFVALLAVGIVLAGVYVFRGALLAPHVKRFLVSSIESNLGIPVTIGGIDGSYLTNLELTRVTGGPPDRGLPAFEMTIGRARAEYPPWALVRGVEAFVSRMTISLEGVRLEIDLSSGEEPPDKTGADDVPWAGAPPQFLPGLQVRDMAVFLRGAGYETSFERISLETRETGPLAREFLLSVGDWRWTHPFWKDGQTDLSAPIRYEKGVLTVGPVKIGGKTFVELLRVEPGLWPSAGPLDATVTTAGGHVAIRGSLDAHTVNARLEADGIHLPPVAGLFGPHGRELDGTLFLKAEVVWPLQRAKDMEAALQVRVDRGRIYGLNVGRLEADGSVGGGRIAVDRLVVSTGPNTAEARDVAAPVETVFAGDLRGLLQSVSASIALDFRDVPRLFSLAGADLPEHMGPAPPHKILLAGRVHGGTIDLSAGSLEVGDGAYIRLAPSWVTLPAGNRPMADAAVHAGLEMDVSDLGLIGRLVAVPRLIGSLRGGIAVSGTFGDPSGAMTATGKGIVFQDMAIGDVRLQARADAGAAVVESLVIERGQDRIRGRGKILFEKRAFEYGDVEFRVSELAPYAEMLLPERWKVALGHARINGALSGHVTVAGPLTMPGGTAAMEARHVSIGGKPFGDATMRLEADGRRVRVEALDVRHLQDRITLNGSFRIAPRFAEIIADNVDLKIVVFEMAAYTENLLPKGRVLGGSVQGTVLASGPLTAPEARWDLAFKGLRWGGVDLHGAGVTGFSSVGRITVARAEVEAAQGQISPPGRPMRGYDDTQFDLELDELAFSGPGWLLALDKPVHIRLAPAGMLWLKDVSLRGPAGGIHLDGTIDRLGESDLRVSVSGVSGDGWFDSLVTDRLRFSGLNARARLTGPMDDLRMNLEGELAKLLGRDDLGALAGRFDLTLEKRGITIRRFEWRGDKGQEITVTGSLPIPPAGSPLLAAGPLSIDAAVNLSELGLFSSVYPEVMPRGGSFHGELHMRGTWEEPIGEILFRGRRLKTPPHPKPMPSGPFDMDGRIRFEERRAVVETLRVTSPDLTFSAEGTWTGIPAWLDIFHDGARKQPGHVALTGRLHVPNLSWLAEQSPAIRRISGELEAEFSIEGPLSDPAVTGAIRLTDGELRSDKDLPSIQALHLEALAAPERLQLLTLTGELGGAAFQVTGSLQRSGASGIEADLRLRGENLLFYRSEGVRARTDADLTLTGPVSRLTLGGEVSITDGHFFQYFDVLGAVRRSEKPGASEGFELFSIREPPFRDAVFNVRITAKQPFRVRNNLIKGAIRPDLNLGGTGEGPLLTGIVYVDSTHLALPAGTVIFDSGVIRFDKSRPDRPTLDLIGKSRMAGYDITVVVEGPYDEPAVALSSVPPLSSEDLLLLVLTGRLPESTQGLTSSQRQQMNLAVYLGRDLIARWFLRQNPEAEASVLDRFQLDIGRAVTRTGDDTVEAQFRLAEGFLREGDTLYLTGEKDAFDFYNAGIKIVFRFK